MTKHQETVQIRIKQLGRIKTHKTRAKAASQRRDQPRVGDARQRALSATENYRYLNK